MWRALAITLSLTTLACGTAEAQPTSNLHTQSLGVATQATDPCRPGDRPCWLAHIEHQRNVAAWWAEVRARQIRARDYARLLRFAAAVEAARLAQAARPQPDRSGRIMGRGTCGGDLPPCWVLRNESGGYLNLYYGGTTYQRWPNYSASGKWAFVRRTWAGFGGYRNAADAPESVQDAKARQLWNHGRGCSHWSAC